MIEICEEMLSGQVKIEPCKSSKVTYCDYCNYSAICQFDTSIRDNKYKVILKKKKDDLWNQNVCENLSMLDVLHMKERGRTEITVLKSKLLKLIQSEPFWSDDKSDLRVREYNFDEEYRPKLFRRLRSFVWEEPIHETVRLEPVVYDSDIVITHMPEQNHAGRDLANFRKQIAQARLLSRRLYGMYARELFLAGEARDFLEAEDYFRAEVSSPDRSADEITEGCCVVARAARLRGAAVTFFKYTSKVIAGDGCSEICCELGYFYEETGDFEEAAVWYYNAAYETQPVLALRSSEEEPLQGLIRCYEHLGLPAQARSYAEELKHRQNEQTDN